jgi:chemotaxis-related protein WspB
MLLLTFRAAGNAYAVEARRVIEIVPRIAVRTVPHAPGFLVGLIHYRGAIVPVIDMGLLMGGAACRTTLDTRIIIAEYPVASRDQGMLGLLAERVNDLKDVTAEHQVSPAMNIPEAVYLGPIFRADDILVQVIDVAELLPESLRASLFGEPAEER